MGVNMPVWGVTAVVKLCLRWGFSARLGLGRPIFGDFFEKTAEKIDFIRRFYKKARGMRHEAEVNG